MPHFSDALDSEDPALLRKLRAALHAPGTAPRPRPTREDRFGIAATDAPAPKEPVLAGLDPAHDHGQGAC